ncbi:hypothetical protein EV426DRAFT_713451 [Tirmania nivea]|nr:hypothetical protein EV426DRAFT_713451 [Tirmania nivea]
MSYEGTPGGSSPGIGIPQLAACLLIGYLFFRWYNSSPPPTSSGTGSTTSTTAAHRRPPPAQDFARLQQRAEIVHGMFPQISMSSIKWELQKNGGSVEITTEKILAQGYLPEPPAPVNQAGSAPRSRAPTPAGGAVAGAVAGAVGSSSSTPKPYTDLITRYNLADKLAASSSDDEVTAQGRGKASSWSQDKQERQALLQKRRDDMVLKARRKLEEKVEKEEKEKASS